MKKLICLILAAMMLLTAASALADTTINREENRGITLVPATEYELEEGISPTTGLTLSTLNVPAGFTGMAVTGRYLPILSQISNEDGGVGHRAPWGASYADIVYEMPLYENGATRQTFLFNDLVPDAVGPVRSARVGHVWLREEWGAGFLYWGQQEYERTNVIKEFRNLGHDYIYDDLLFNGLSGGKAWNKYYSERSGLAGPNDKSANAAAIYTLIPEDYVAPYHAFRFTDEMPEGDDAQSVKVSWYQGANDLVYGSQLIYDVDANAYLRYLRGKQNKLTPFVDKDTGEQIAFANVIVQFVKVTYHGSDAPVVELIGKNGNDYTAVEGNADFFMGGKHIAGYWKRDSVTSRTVYYGPDGEEISLLRGKSLILLFPNADHKNSQGKEFHSEITYSEIAQ